MSSKKVRRLIATVTFMLMAVTVIPASIAHPLTEKYIPIGMSPGVSDKVSFQGEISGVDRAAKSFSVRVDGGSQTFSVSSSTYIWLDRSKVGKPSIDGSFGDLEGGRRIEVKYDSDDPSVASWIKIETQ